MKKLLLIILSLFMAVQSIFAMGGHQHGDIPSVHGMLLFGKQDLYISHLPMFHAPHNYQAIASIELSEKNKKLYLNSKKNNPLESVYTIVPEVFVLPEVIVEGATFKAKIFKGHFERGGQSISEIVEFKIKEVIYLKILAVNSAPLAQLTYIYFGGNNEIYAAHIISAKPGFDQIVQVKLTRELVGSIRNKKFINVVFPEQDISEPLVEGILNTAQLKTDKGTFSLNSQDILEVLYTEFNDLSF